jgi:predicted transcriptional regulator
MFRKLIGTDKLDDLIESSERNDENFEDLFEEFENLVGINKKVRRDVSKIKKNTDELLKLRDEITKKQKIKVEFDSQALEKSLVDKLGETERQILDKIHARFSLVENTLIDMTNRVAENHKTMQSLKYKLSTARKELMKKGIYSADINSSLELTLSSLELEIFTMLDRAGEMDLKELSSTLGVDKGKVIQTVQELKDLEILEEVNLGRRVVYKTSNLLSYNK